MFGGGTKALQLGRKEEFVSVREEKRMAKVTIYSIEREVDESRLREMFLLFESFGDYERRLLQAKLNEMNKKCNKYLPPYALQRYGIKL